MSVVFDEIHEPVQERPVDISNGLDEAVVQQDIALEDLEAVDTPSPNGGVTDEHCRRALCEAFALCAGVEIRRRAVHALSTTISPVWRRAHSPRLDMQIGALREGVLRVQRDMDDLELAAAEGIARLEGEEDEGGQAEDREPTATTRPPLPLRGGVGQHRWRLGHSELFCVHGRWGAGSGTSGWSRSGRRLKLAKCQRCRGR